MGIVIIRKPPTEANAMTIVPAEEGEGFLIYDENGELVATALTEEDANSYANVLARGE